MELAGIDRNLETERLHLRPLQLSDADSAFSMMSDEESMRYWSHPPLEDIDGALAVIRRYVESDEQGNSANWAVVLKEGGAAIGMCSLFNFGSDNRRAEIGYILERSHWRRGLMREALGAVIAFAFDTLDFHRIEADVDPDNAASLGLLEALGFEREGLFRERWLLNGEWVDSVMLGLVKREA